MTRVIHVASLPVSAGRPFLPKSWFPRTRSFRPGMARTRARRSRLSAPARAMSPPQMIVSASPTVSLHAARRASFITSTLWNGLLQ